MAVRRKNNILNQQRLNVPELRSIESSVSNDFDELIKGLITGQGKSYFINGFEINMTGAINSSATGLQVIVADSAVLHGNSLESGTFYTVPVGTPNEILNSNTNSRVSGSFTPNALNYVGIEYERVIDPTTTAQSYFWNPSSKSEFTKTVPAAIILKYKFVITSSVWASNVLPLAIVDTNSVNNVKSVEDRRPLLFRLGTAGSTTPDATYSYPWTNHSEGREENFWKSSSSTSPFRGGDKQIKSEKEWKDAVMSMIKEVKGTPYWYSENTGGSILKLKLDIANSIMTGSGSISHALIGGKSRLNWDSDIFFNLIGSRLSYKLSVNALNDYVELEDDQVAYIKLVRGQNIIPNLIFTYGISTVTSVGEVSWTNDVQAGDYLKLTSDIDTKYIKILSVNPLNDYEVTLEETWPYLDSGIDGIKAQYAWGTYSAVSSPSTDRHVKIDYRKNVPVDEDTQWLFLRQDNGGSLARVYIKGGAGGELEEGESRQISDNENNEIIAYVGSPSEHTSLPNYVNADGISVAEVTTFTFPSASSITSGQSHTLNASGDNPQYYVWFNKNGLGGDPIVEGKKDIEVAISTGDTDVDVADAWASAVGAISDFSVVDNLDGTVTVTNALVGTTTNAGNIDVGGSFSISVDIAGAGTPNYVVTDGHNLTLAVKKLDQSTGQLLIDTEKEFDQPLKMFATSPSANAVLNFSSSLINASDSAKKVVSPVKKQIFPSIIDPYLNFQTHAVSSASHFDVTWPSSNTVGYFRYAGFTLISSGKIKIIFSEEASSEASLSNPGGLFATGGLPIGYIALECTDSLGYFKTAGSTSNVIENQKIYRFGSGAGGGSGTGDANSFTENLKHRLTSSFYEFVTPNVFEIEESNLIQSATATFDIVDGVYNFSAPLQNIVSVNMFDTDFLGSDDDSRRVELHAEWFDSASRDDNATYAASLDGVNYEPITMTRQNLSNKFTGDVLLSVPSSVSLFAQATDTQTTELNATTLRSIATKFTVSDKSAINELILRLVKTGSPNGSYTVSIVQDSSNSPTGSVIYSTIALCSSLSAGTNILTLSGFRNILTAGSYWIKIETDATYRSSFVASTTSIGVRSTTGGSDFVYNGTTWSAGTASVRYQVSGHVYDLRVKITSSASDKKIKAYGIFYDENISNVITGTQALQKFTFSGDLNTTSFIITSFLPDADNMKVYDIRTGQVYRYPAFSISGHTVTFASGSFLAPGETVELIFDQSQGSGFDNSDANANLLATNHLGSTDGTIDKSAAGRGIYLRSPNGTLREICIDDSDNIVIYSV